MRTINNTTSLAKLKSVNKFLLSIRGTSSVCLKLTGRDVKQIGLLVVDVNKNTCRVFLQQKNNYSLAIARRVVQSVLPISKYRLSIQRNNVSGRNIFLLEDNKEIATILSKMGKEVVL